MKLACASCKQSFTTASGYRAAYCSEQCRLAAKAALSARVHQYWQQRQQRGAADVTVSAAPRRETVTETVSAAGNVTRCAQCHRPLTGRRHKKFCGAACKQAAHRQSKMTKLIARTVLTQKVMIG